MQDLVETIANAPIYHLRAVLQLVCAESEEARSQAEKSFKDLHVADQLAPVGRKRKAEIPVDMCLRCKEPFYPDANKGKDCRYHDGEPEVDDDDDFWADHDENCHGPIDSAYNRREFPEGFIWTCCDNDLTAEGCKTGRHRTAGFKKWKYGSKSVVLASSDESESESEESDSEGDDESEATDEEEDSGRESDVTDEDDEESGGSDEDEGKAE